jgi:hypothetical protein
MQKIPLILVKPGMVLARDVFRKEGVIGMPICGKGTEMTDLLISRLDHMDVQSVYVEGHPVWEEGERSLEDMLCELEKRFEKVKHDPLTVKLHDIYADYLKRSMGDDGG